MALLGSAGTQKEPSPSPWCGCGFSLRRSGRSNSALLGGDATTFTAFLVHGLTQGARAVPRLRGISSRSPWLG